MWLECGWRHVRKRWSWEFEDFEKEAVEGWHWTMQADSWVLCHWSRKLSFLPLRRRRLSFSGLDRRRWIETLNITRCAARWDEVRLWRILSFSSCCHGPRPKINKRVFVWNNRVPLCFRFYLYMIVLLLQLTSPNYTTRTLTSHL